MFAAVTGTLFSKMAKSSLRGRRNKQNNPQLDLWEFANRLTLHSKKNTLNRPPGAKSTEEEQNAFTSRLAMLEIAEVERPCLFKTSTHLVSKLIKFDEDTDCFYVQPYNQSGDKDGKAQVEQPSDLWVFPPVGTVVKIAPTINVMVKQYDVTSCQVLLETAAPAAAPAEKTPQKKKPRKTPTKKTPAKKPPTTKTRKRKAKKTPTPKKKKPRKKPLDKVTTTATSTEETLDDGESKYTVEKVLKSFSNPRSTCDSLLVCLLIYVCFFRLFVHRFAARGDVQEPGIGGLKSC